MPPLIPESLELMQWQKNEVLARILEAGLDANAFEWSRVRQHPTASACSKITHTTSGFFVAFLFDVERASCSPGRDKRVEEYKARDWPTFEQVVAGWTQLLRRELDAPDLWGDIRRLRETGGAALLGDGMQIRDAQQPLSDEAVARASRGLAELRLLVARSKEIPSTERPAVERVLDQVEQASQRRENNGIRVSLVALKDMVQGAILTEFVKKGIAEPTVRWILPLLASALGWVAHAVRELAP